MWFKIQKASDWDYKSEKDISTLEELMEFVKENGEIIVRLKESLAAESCPTIKIYDDYVE